MALAISAAIAPTLAWLSLDTRPELIPAAALAALITGLISPFFFPIALVIATIWIWAWTGRPVKVEVSRGLWWARVALAMAAAASVFALFAHLDPVCTETLADGTVLEVAPVERGLRTGWRLEATNSITTGSQPDFECVVSSSCSSDTIVSGEALASIAVSLGAIGAAVMWWPVGKVDISARTETILPDLT